MAIIGQRTWLNGFRLDEKSTSVCFPMVGERQRSPIKTCRDQWSSACFELLLQLHSMLGICGDIFVRIFHGGVSDSI